MINNMSGRVVIVLCQHIQTRADSESSISDTTRMRIW